MAYNEKVQEAYEKLEQGLVTLVNSAKWNELGRRVKKGEKAIKIFAPLKVKVKQESEPSDVPDQEKNAVQKLVGFRLVNVFDISQTEGSPVPASVPMISARGECGVYELLKATCPLPVIELDDCDGAYGYINFSQKKIYILSSLTSKEKATTLVHEWGHWLLHALRRDLDTGIKELEAESVSYIVCDALGIDTSQFSFVYIAEWCHREDVIERLKVSGDRICKASREILESLEQNEWSEAV